MTRESGIRQRANRQWVQKVPGSKAGGARRAAEGGRNGINVRMAPAGPCEASVVGQVLAPFLVSGMPWEVLCRKRYVLYFFF